MKLSGNASVSDERFSPLDRNILISVNSCYLQSCKEQRGGASSVTIIKYAIKKYPSVEMDKKTKNLYKKALKRLVEKGAVRQVSSHFLLYI